MRVLLLVVLGLSAAPAPVLAQAQSDYIIRAEDVLEITIWNQSNLRTRYPVEPDGMLTFPFIGRVKAEGLTLFQLETELKKKLAPDFFRNPQITVRIEQFRAGRVFIFGGVGSPGPIPLTPNMTLIEALAKAGYGNASEAVIVRPSRDGGSTGSTQNTAGREDANGPEEPDAADVIRVNLREFEKDVQQGELSRNVLLRDGDQIYVPRHDPNRIFVLGEVRTPGPYSIAAGTTVLQALALAGGITENGSMGRISIIRMVDGKKKTIKGKPDTIVEFGDTIMVRERFF